MYKFRVKQDNAGEWRWTLIAGNGEPVADSGEGYTRKAECLRAIERVKKNAPTAEVVIEESA